MPKNIILFVLPLLLLLSGLGVTYQYWQLSVRVANAELQEQFNHRADEIERRITQRLQDYAMLLNSVRGLFYASQSVERDEFKQFIDSLGIKKHFQGIQAVGYAEKVPVSEKRQHITRLQQSGFPDYQIFPAADNAPFYTAIIYTEPFNKDNAITLGYDMFTEANRRKAMQTTCATNAASISEDVTLLQDTGKPHSVGFVMYLPVFRQGSEAQCPARLQGWGFLAFRLDDLVKNLFGELDDVDIEIYSHAPLSTETALYLSSAHQFDPEQPVYRTLKTIRLEDTEAWWVNIHSLSTLEARLDLKRSLLIAGAGIGGSVMLSFIVLLLIRRRQNAISAAAQLQLSEQRLQVATQAAGVGIWDLDLRTNELVWDDTMFALYGARHEDFPGAYDAWATRLHPDDKARTEQALQNAIACIKDYTPEFRVQLPDGGIRYIKSYARVIKNAAGKPVRMIGTSWDNYEHAVTQKQLQLAHITISNSQNAFFWLDAKGRLVDVNNWACQSLGYSREELLGQEIPFYSSYFPKDGWEHSWSQLKQEKKRILESHHQRKDGSIFPVGIVTNYVCIEGEEYCFAYVEDISERKHTEAEIHIAATIFESQVVGMVITDAATKIIKINQAFSHITGYSEAELLHQKPKILHSGRHDKAFYDRIWQGIRTEGFWQGEIWNKRKNGEIYPEWLTISTVKNAEAQVTHYVATHTDITRRKQADEALAASERRLHEIINLMPLAVFIKDAKGQIQIMNHACEKQWGIEFRQLFNTTGGQLFSPERIADFLEEDQQMFANGQLLEMEEKVWNAQLQASRIVHTYKKPVFTQSGEPDYLIGVSVDITQDKQQAQVLHEAVQRAEAANHAKSEFLANMSHEIRTPMNAILGFSDILSDLITDSTHRYYLDAIHRSGKILLQLINDILDLSKIEAGKLSLQYKPVSLRGLLNDIEIVFLQRAKNKSIAFSVMVDQHLPDNIIVDEIRLRQVLLNLIGNAIKFTDHGFVKVLVSGKVNDAENQVNLSIAVYDSGIGIPKAQQDKIFAAFTQQDNQSHEYGGTGLGLTISKRLSELMHGTIGLESTPGEGSCFTVTLNALEYLKQANQDKKITPAPARLVKNIRFKPARILLVDDLAINRQLIQSYLAEFSELTLIEAESGERALTLAAQQLFDLVLMDRRLPDMVGDGVCQQIKALPDCAETPIIMITASVLKATEKQTVFYDLQLHKPVNKTELLTAMQSFLATSKTEESAAQTVITEITGSVAQTMNSELAAVLNPNYRERVQQLNLSGVMDIDVLIELAQELLALAKQYECHSLALWANTLKNQAELFDIANLPKTLKSFENLFEK